MSSYQDVVALALKPGFGFRELVHDGVYNKQLPPEFMWPRIVPTLDLANALRLAMIGLGAHGLLIHAAYRPEGGAVDSAHKHNRALDLDLLPGDYDMAEEYYLEATRLWCMHGVADKIGLGLYCSAGRRGGIRVHFDVGHDVPDRGHGSATWQNTGPHAVHPPLALSLAHELGLASPIHRKAGLDE